MRFYIRETTNDGREVAATNDARVIAYAPTWASFEEAFAVMREAARTPVTCDHYREDFHSDV